MTAERIQRGAQRRSRRTAIRGAVDARADAAPVLGFVGFVRDWHGLDEVLRAHAPDEPVHATSAPSSATARRGPRWSEAASLGIADRVRFTGVVPPDVPALVADFDIALQPRSPPMPRR